MVITASQEADAVSTDGITWKTWVICIGGFLVALVCMYSLLQSIFHDTPGQSRISTLPGTNISPITAWGSDGPDSMAKMRLVTINGECFVETSSGDNGLNVGLAPSTGCASVSGK